MAPLARDAWLAIGTDLIEGMGPARTAKKHGVQVRTIDEAIARFKATGSIFPAKPGRKKGGKHQHLRKTTKAQDQGVKPLIKKKRGGPLEWTANKTKAALKMKVHRTQVCRRIGEVGLKAYKPARKESYSNPDKKKRLAYCMRYRKDGKRVWMRTVFIDEHLLIHVNPGKVAHRQLHAGKRFIYREKDERHAEDCTSLKKGKNTKGGKGIMLACAQLMGKVLLISTVASLLARSERRPPPPIKYSKKGKVLGRPRTQKTLKKRGYDGPAHAVFLEDCAVAARKMLGLKPGDPIRAYQDGDRLHWTDECKDVMQKENYGFLEGVPTYSPGLNPPENMFSMGDEGVLERQAISYAKDPEETLKRFRAACKDAEKAGHLKRATENYPERMEAVIRAAGGPTRY